MAESTFKYKVISRQVVKFVDDCLEGIFEELLLAVTESADSLFNVVEARFVLVVQVVDLLTEDDNVILHPLVVLKLL
jgi:hypothetical protein